MLLSEGFDMEFYREKISPVLPPVVLDFHAHIWKRNQWISEKDRTGTEAANKYESLYRDLPRAMSAADSASVGFNEHARYMSTLTEYSYDDLKNDAKKIFPDNTYEAVVFGQPTTAVDTDKTNAYVVKSATAKGIYPLLITGTNRVPSCNLRQEILENGFFGYKVFLDWVGNDYGSLTVVDMLNQEQMALANELGLIVLLHVPGAGRMADPQVQEGVLRLAKNYPNAKIVLAHCGRCYLPDEMQRAIKSFTKQDNIYVDTAMVMEPIVLQMVFENMNSERVLYATDFPVAAMLGRRVYAADHWVDLVRKGYPESEYRVASDNFRATYMAHEIVAAIVQGAKMAGINDGEVRSIFHDNGEKLLGSVLNGKQ